MAIKISLIVTLLIMTMIMESKKQENEKKASNILKYLFVLLVAIKYIENKNKRNINLTTIIISIVKYFDVGPKLGSSGGWNCSLLGTSREIILN